MPVKCFARKSCLCRCVRNESTLERISQMKTSVLRCQALSKKLLVRDKCVLSSAKRDNRKTVINFIECPRCEETDRKKPKVFCETNVKISRLIAKQFDKFWRPIWSWGKCRILVRYSLLEQHKELRLGASREYYPNNEPAERFSRAIVRDRVKR